MEGRALVWPALALSALLVQATPAAPGGAPAAPAIEAAVYLRQDGGGRRLRGDWEPPDLVLVGWAAAWEEPLRELLRALDGVDAALVLGAGDDPAAVRAWLAAEGLEDRVAILAAGTDSPWVRDYGPLQTTEDGGLLWLDAPYSPGRPADDELPSLLAPALGVPVEPLAHPLQGGALISDGRGLCITTLPDLAGACVDPVVPEALMQSLGCDALAVVPPLEADPNGHVDMLAQLLGPDTIAVAQADPAELPEDAARLEAAVDAIRRAAAALGRSIDVVRLPLHRDTSGIYSSFANGLHLPGAFLMPTFRGAPPEAEARALAALRAALPGKRVVPIAADAIAQGHGALHCMTLGVAVGTGTRAAAR